MFETNKFDNRNWGNRYKEINQAMLKHSSNQLTLGLMLQSTINTHFNLHNQLTISVQT